MTEQSPPAIQAIREALVAAATLGTERRPFELPPATGTLGAALARIDPNQGSEHALLSAAAIVTSYERAGYHVRPTPDTALVPPSPDDAVPTCSPIATQHLHTMLSGSYRAALPEWLALLAAKGKRVPARLLPDLLEAGRHTVDLRPLIRAVIGIRGQWLAAQNPDWHYASVATTTDSLSREEATSVWETGTRATRLALLEEVRGVAPDLARELIESTWASEKADDRAAFLEKLSTALRMADEAFLEAALDDRSKEVRKIASELLARLPDSRLVQRMIARVTSLLRWSPPGGTRFLGLMQGKPGSIEVTLPDACDKAMVRDGLEPKPPTATDTMGARTRWLWHMLRAIPPAHWVDQWQASPDQIIAAANAQTEWSDTLKWAWTEAAQSYQDQVWAEALLQVDPERYTLLSILPVERQEAALVHLLKRTEAADLNTITYTLLRNVRHQWSMTLSRAVLEIVSQQFQRPPERRYYALIQVLNEAGYRLPPTLLPEALALRFNLQEHQEQWQRASEQMLTTLQFRHEMHEALEL